MSEKNKALIRRFAEELWSKGDLGVADEIIHPRTRNPRGTHMWSNGPESVKEHVASVRQSYPDLHRTINDMVAEGDKVVLYSTFTGTHTGEGGWCPFAPTGAKFTMTGVATFAFKDGKIVEEPWSSWNFADITGPSARALVRRMIEEVVVGGRLEVMERLVAPDFVNHNVAGTGEAAHGVGVEPFKREMAALRAAFPDISASIEDIVAEGDRISVRGRMRGTHLGPFMGLAPTGRRIDVASFSSVRIANGRLAERWHLPDRAAVLEQLGVAPTVLQQVEQNKAVARRFVEEFWIKANVKVLDEIATPDVVHHDNKASRLGREWKPYIAKAYAAFPGWQFIVEDMFAEGDKVCIRYLWRAVQRTEFGPYKPTGAEITAPCISVLRFAGGKIAEVWTAWDTAAMKP
jgi:predicted ester cyclase